MKPFLVAKQGESKRLVKVSLKLVREIVFPVVLRDLQKKNLEKKLEVLEQRDTPSWKDLGAHTC